MTSSLATTKPWFRHAEPWLLLAAPFAAIIAGGFTWWIAAHSNNSLKVRWTLSKVLLPKAWTN